MASGSKLTSRDFQAVRATATVALLLAAIVPATLLSTIPAFALSEIKREELPPPPLVPGQTPPSESTEPLAPSPIPAPSTPIDPQAPTGPAQPAAPGGTAPDTPAIDNQTAVPDEAEEPVPDVLYDLQLLPEPVRRMHALLLEACKSGDVEKLRPLLGTGDSLTQLSFGDTPEDPIAFLKSASGDGEGHEILAIMEEVLSAGYVHLDTGTPEELYVWPYFFAVPLDKLTAPQRVELFKIITFGDYEGMKEFGSYVFYRLGIAPDGRWAFFVAGD